MTDYLVGNTQSLSIRVNKPIQAQWQLFQSHWFLVLRTDDFSISIQMKDRHEIEWWTDYIHSQEEGVAGTHAPEGKADDEIPF